MQTDLGARQALIPAERPEVGAGRLVETASEAAGMLQAYLDILGSDGTYDVTVTSGDRVVATFVGRSREIGGTLWGPQE